MSEVAPIVSVLPHPIDTEPPTAKSEATLIPQPMFVYPSTVSCPATQPSPYESNQVEPMFRSLNHAEPPE